MYTAVSKLLKLSLECFMEQDGVNKPEEKLAEIAILEASIDKMERRYQKHHIKRLAKGECEPRAGLLFSDMLSELERIADHSENKAILLLVNPTMKKEEINLDLNKVKEGVNENALQALLKNLSNAVIKTNVAPIDYKVIEL